jgi:dishevelled associated activator of morphogenesis
MPPVEEVDTMLELLMEDLNLADDKKKAIRNLAIDKKWAMVQHHLGERVSFRSTPGFRLCFFF